MIFIAEVKTKSPFGFYSNKLHGELFEVAKTHGDIIAVHTNPLFGGSFELLNQARALTNKLILAKGIHETDSDIERALISGADYVLVVGRIPSSLYWSNCIIEPYTIEELKAIPSGVKAMWNSRDLKTGLNKIETFDEARKTRPDLWLVQASNIRSVSDVDDRANAFIVGSCLVDFVKEYGVK